MSWADDELQHANLGDRRLNRRLVTLIETLARHPETSLPQACAFWAQTKAAYRFFASCRRAEMAVETNTIIGYPNETREDLEASLEMIFDAAANAATAADISILQPLPGSPIAETHAGSLCTR